MEPDTILLEDYKQKISYLTGHVTRMWKRFNFFVTIESVLIGGMLNFTDWKLLILTGSRER